MVADNTRLIQHLLDQQCRLANGSTPLVLLEMPPSLPLSQGRCLSEIFQIVSEQTPCGLVLDVGIFGRCFDIPERIELCR